MYEMVKRSIRCALIAALALGGLVGVASAQEGEDSGQEDISNVLLTFHLIQADGFTDQDPEISDVVTELRSSSTSRGTGCFRLRSSTSAWCATRKGPSYLAMAPSESSRAIPRRR